MSIKVIIELEFDERPTEADVINYLNELIDNECLGYITETGSGSTQEGVR